MTDLGIKALEVSGQLGLVAFLICLGVIAMIIGLGVMFAISKVFVNHIQKTASETEVRIDKKDTEHRQYVDGIAKAYEERLERKDSLHRDERKEWREDIGQSLDKLAQAIDQQNQRSRQYEPANKVAKL